MINIFQMPQKNTEPADISSFTFADWQEEEKRLRKEKKYVKTFMSTTAIMLVVAAISILVASLWIPVLSIHGASMTPTLYEGELVACLKTNDFKAGDIIAFYYNNKILVKRVIASAGQWVDIDSEGTVYLNGKELEEPYIQEKALGKTNIDYPYQVPEDRYFVMGDHRDTSLDSRTKAIGTVAEEQVIGKLFFSLYPFSGFGAISN